MRALQRAIADACLGADADHDLARDLRGFLTARGVAPHDVEAILAAPPRLGVYRSLVRNGLSSVVARMLPRTRARMNAVSAGRFDADLARFVDEVGPRTHYLRDVPAEFYAWVQPRWRSDAALPPYMADLAAHELEHFAVAASGSAGEPQSSSEVALHRSLGFVESARVVRYEWAVHELPADPSATDPPPRRHVQLLVYRDAAHTVRWFDLTPLAAAVLERLLVGDALGTAVETACAGSDTAPAHVLPDIARLLADLAKLGVIVGAKGE
jgi:hypothetical protein